MIIVYDFKIPANDAEKFKEDKELFTDYFINCLNNYAQDKFEPFLERDRNFDVKILKKSVDLRQKEQKKVFKVLIKLNTAAGQEDGFIGLLDKIGVKARKADNEEERLFNLEEADISMSAEVQNKNIAKRNKTKVLITGMGPAGIFAAAYLLKNGIKPILIEKGKRVEDRIKDVEDLLDNAEEIFAGTRIDNDATGTHAERISAVFFR